MLMGAQVKRRHPHATETVLTDVNIERRGKFYYATNDAGKFLLKKKIGSTGTWVEKKR